MDKAFKPYIKMVSFLSETLENGFEVVLFDINNFDDPLIASLSMKESTIVKAIELVKEAMNNRIVVQKGYCTNRAIPIDENKISKMSIYFVLDDNNKMIGALCLCINCEPLFKMMNFVSGILNFDNHDFDDNLPYSPMPATTRDLSLDAISDYIHGFGVELGNTTYDENLEIICDLYDMGVFNLKGAVAKTAEELQISQKTIYRYLAKIKNARE